jgi:hypothetical protein
MRGSYSCRHITHKQGSYSAAESPIPSFTLVFGAASAWPPAAEGRGARRLGDSGLASKWNRHENLGGDHAIATTAPRLLKPESSCYDNRSS